MPQRRCSRARLASGWRAGTSRRRCRRRRRHSRRRRRKVLAPRPHRRRRRRVVCSVRDSPSRAERSRNPTTPHGRPAPCEETLTSRASSATPSGSRVVTRSAHVTRVARGEPSEHHGEDASTASRRRHARSERDRGGVSRRRVRARSRARRRCERRCAALPRDVVRRDGRPLAPRALLPDGLRRGVSARVRLVELRVCRRSDLGRRAGLHALGHVRSVALTRRRGSPRGAASGSRGTSRGTSGGARPRAARGSRTCRP